MAGQGSPSPMSRVHALAVGQVAEWLVWARLVAGSDGDLHVFLPLDRRGVDGIVHRISTDEFARVQVTWGGSQVPHGVAFHLLAGDIEDERSTLVAVQVDLRSFQLWDYVLVIPTPAFRELAHRSEGSRSTTFRAQTALPPTPDSPWAPWCVRVEDLGSRLLPPRVGGARVHAAQLPTPHAAPEADRPDPRKRLGHRAEMELVRAASQHDSLNVFKAVPDLEANEYLLYNVVSREIVGIQVKSVSFQHDATETHVTVYRPALRPSPQTWFVIFLCASGQSGFLSDCLVIPSQVVGHMLSGEISGTFAVTRGGTGRLAPWRVPLLGLTARLAELTASSSVPGHN